MAKIKVRYERNYTAVELLGWKEIDSEDYEELKGMSEEEMKEYLQDDLEIESLSTGQFLSEELTTMDVEWDETTEDDYEAQFESAD
jgi:hypothetical protein